MGGYHGDHVGRPSRGGGGGYKLVRKCLNLLLKTVYFLCYILKQISANESSKRGMQKIPNKRISSGYNPDSLQFASKRINFFREYGALWAK